MSRTVHFKTNSTIAGGVGTPITGDTVNQTERDIIAALGGLPGSGATYDWPPHIPNNLINLRTDYDLALDGVTDDWSGLQSALDDAELANDTLSIRTILHPGGCAVHSKPLWLKGQGIQFLGNYQGVGTGILGLKAGASQIMPSYAGGPSIIVAPSPATIHGLVSSLVPGPGNAWQANGFGRWFNLRMSKTMELNGLPAFTIEEWYQNGSAVQDALCTTGFNSGTAKAFFFVANANGSVSFGLTLSTSGVVSLTGGSGVHDGVPHHLAGTYDGSTVRLFVDGTMVASSAGSGTIVQGLLESTQLGSANAGTWEQNGVMPSVGTHDAVHCSNVARYTADFPPPAAKPAKDSHTLGLLNFDSVIGPAVRMETNLGDVWLVVREQSGTGAVQGIGFRGLFFDSPSQGGSGGIETAYGSVCNWVLDRCAFQNQRRALSLGPAGTNSFSWGIRDCYFHTNSGNDWGQVFMGFGAGIGSIWNTWFNVGRVGVVAVAGGLTLDNVFLQFTNQTVYGASIGSEIVTNCPSSFRAVTTDAESGVAADFVAPFHIWSKPGCVAAGLRIESSTIQTANAKPFFALQGEVDLLHAEDVMFCSIDSLPSSIITGASVMSRPAKFDNCWQKDGWVPWSDVAGTALVAEIGKHAAITYSATPALACDVRDGFELSTALTGDITPTFSRMTPKQEITLLVKQDGSGGHAVNFGAEVKLASAVDTVANHYSLWTFEVALDGKLYQKSFASGA